MNFGVVGWGNASGNGGMNSDIVQLASWVTHWLVPEHPKSGFHAPYIDRLEGKSIIRCKLSGDEDKYLKFLNEVDGILYVEHPCLRDGFDIVLEAKKRNKIVVGIPMWEWWPERKHWAMQTDILWAVTKFTHRYLASLSDVLYVHGWKHNWRHRIYGNRWGVNLDDFPFRERFVAKNFVFINGNGGYNLRKASDLVFDAFSKPDSPKLLVYTQQIERISSNIHQNIELVNKNYPDRKDVYCEGDVFLFPSYWEGLCHGIYEGQASGGLVITTDHAPMNECGTDLLVPVTSLEQESIDGKKIVKAVADADYLHMLCKDLAGTSINALSKRGRKLIEERFNLKETLELMHGDIVSGCY
jgi:glycosyltransferase involved in cell wall biosynthesis